MHGCCGGMCRPMRQCRSGVQDAAAHGRLRRQLLPGASRSHGISGGGHSLLLPCSARRRVCRRPPWRFWPFAGPLCSHWWRPCTAVLVGEQAAHWVCGRGLSLHPLVGMQVHSCRTGRRAGDAVLAAAGACASLGHGLCAECLGAWSGLAALGALPEWRIQGGSLHFWPTLAPSFLPSPPNARVAVMLCCILFAEQHN